jgi:hypothetical protein
MLYIIITSISVVDIRTRYVSPVLIVPLLIAVLTGWMLDGWAIAWLGGAMALVGTAALKLPLGDVLGYTLCGLLAGPMPTIWALAVAATGLFLMLHFFGHRINLVRHPFFPYLAALVAAFSLLDSQGIFTAIFTGK